ncbi:MAG: hypothetical protein V2A73_14180, partial [Pseudomonadota bacterium]
MAGQRNAMARAGIKGEAMESFPWTSTPFLRRAQANAARAAAACLVSEQLDDRGSNAIERILARALGDQSIRLELCPVEVLRANELVLRLARRTWTATRIRMADGSISVLVIDGALAGRFAGTMLGIPCTEVPAPRRATLAEQGMVMCLAATVLAIRGAKQCEVEGMADAVDEILSSFPVRQWLVSLEARCQIGGVWGRAIWLTSDSYAYRAASRIPAAAIWSDRAREIMAGIMVRVPVVGGEAHLRVADVAGLEPGDVVILEGVTTAGGGAFPREVALWLGGSFPASVAGTELTITGDYEAQRRDTVEEGTGRSFPRCFSIDEKRHLSMKAPDSSLMKDLPVSLP